MITLGATDYATKPEVILHEIVHQWYGDQVTPDRLARRVDERGHDDVPAVRLPGRDVGHAARADPAAGRAHRAPVAAKVTVRRRRTTPSTFGGAIHLLRPGSDVGPGPAPGRRRAVLGDGAAWPSVDQTAASTARSTCRGSRSRPAPSCPTCSTAGCSRSGRRSSTRSALSGMRLPRSRTAAGRVCACGSSCSAAASSSPGDGGRRRRPRPRRHVRDARPVGRRCPTAYGTWSGTAPTTYRPSSPARSFDAVVDVSRIPSHVRTGRGRVARRALGVRLDGQRVRRQRDARPGHRRPAGRGDRRGPRPQGGPRGVRRHEGRLRAAGARRRRAVDGDPAGADRRPGRPVGPLHLLARAAGRRAARCSARGRPTTACRSSTPATSPSGSCAASSPGRPASSTASGPCMPVGEIIAADRRGRRRVAGRSCGRVRSSSPSRRSSHGWGRGAAAVAAAAGVRRDDDPRLRAVAPGRPRRPAGRRHRPRHPRLAAGDPRAPRTGMSREREAEVLR